MMNEPVTPKLRELYFKIHRGHKPNLEILHLVDGHQHRLEIAEFLISVGLTGSSLCDYYRDKCNGEPIRFLAKVTKALLKVNTAPKLFKGLNYR